MPAVDDERESALRRLGWCRALGAAIVLARTTFIGTPLGRWSADGAWLLGWPDRLWHGNAAFPLPAGVTAALCVLRTIGAVGMLLGAWTRAAAITVTTTGYIVALQRPIGFLATLHLLFLACMLLAFTDAGARVALLPTRPRAPASSLWLIRWFTASVYLWSGLAKLTPDWLAGRTLALHATTGGLVGPLVPILVATDARAAFVARAIAALELALGPLLLWRRTRLAALVTAYLLHAGIELTTKPDALGLGMAALLVCFWPSRTARSDVLLSADGA